MSAQTSIEWCDRTWNPTTGCDKVSPGCAHCYAETVADRFWAKQYPPVPIFDPAKPHMTHGCNSSRPREFTDVQVHDDRLLEPLSWRKPSRIFVNSMSDLFHENIPDEFIDRVFAVMAVTEWHTYQILTKRADRMRAYMSGLTLARLLPWINDHAADGGPLKRETPAGGLVPTGAENLCTVARRVKERVYRFRPDEMPLRTSWPLPNVWLGVSVENQHFASRLTWLLDTPAAVRFVSIEPQLGPVDLTNIEIVAEDGNRPRASLNALTGHVGPDDILPTKLDWVIVGGESGPGARPFDIQWARSIVQQCKAAGVACFVKQLGARPLFHDGGGRTSEGLKDRKGGDPEEWPEDLRVREFPA